MNKIVSASEFKAKCLKIIDTMQQDGQPVTITKRGKVVAEIVPKSAEPALPHKSAFGLLKSQLYRFDMDPSEPASKPEDWTALQ